MSGELWLRIFKVHSNPLILYYYIITFKLYNIILLLTSHNDFLNCKTCSTPSDVLFSSSFPSIPTCKNVGKIYSYVFEFGADDGIFPEIKVIKFSLLVISWLPTKDIALFGHNVAQWRLNESLLRTLRFDVKNCSSLIKQTSEFRKLTPWHAFFFFAHHIRSKW